MSTYTESYNTCHLSQWSYYFASNLNLSFTFSNFDCKVRDKSSRGSFINIENNKESLPPIRHCLTDYPAHVKRVNSRTVTL